MDASEHGENGIRKWVLLFSTPILTLAILGSVISISLPLFYFYTVIVLLNIAPVIYELKETLLENPFSISILMFIASISAFLIGSHLEAGLVLWLYNLAEIIEEKTTDKVRDTVEKLMNTMPKKVIAKRGEKLVEIPVEECLIGDMVVVRKGEMIPVDGVIIEGETVVDEANLTGESIPVEKGRGSEVFSGSINLGNPIMIRVTKHPEEFMVRKILKLVLESKERKARIEGLVQKFARVYTPLIIALVLIVAILPSIAIGGEPKTWIYRAITILVIGCPSAFLISVPLTSLMGLIRSMKQGIMVKGSIYFEEVEASKTVAFDKTGTLTIGELSLSEIKTFNGVSEEEVLKLVASIERFSTHPLADAITREAMRRKIKLVEPDNVEEHIGEGISGTIGNKTLIIGKSSLLLKHGVKVNGKLNVETHKNKMIALVAINGKLAAQLVFDDKPRRETKQLIQKLRNKGYKTVILSGDKKEAVRKIAEDIGVDEFYAELKPEEKLEWVRKLREKGKVIMVGDGVNDAPALAEANVGIAISKLGNDVAIESADIVILNEKIDKILDIIETGKKVMKKQKTNLIATITLKISMIILGFLGYISLWEAVLGDDGLTIALALNSLTLLKNNNN